VGKPLYKRLIFEILKDQFEGRAADESSLVKRSGSTPKAVRLCLERLKKLGALSDEGGLRVSELGRSLIKIVLTGGVFDIIHPGHLWTLSNAKKEGDFLVVVVARDRTVLENKKREPFNKERLRLELVRSLRVVDYAVLGSEMDRFFVVERIRPDVIVLGFDQAHDENALREECRKRGLSRTRVVRLSTPFPGIKTSKLLEDVARRFAI